jgi:hypothetical protein
MDALCSQQVCLNVTIVFLWTLCGFSQSEVEVAANDAGRKRLLVFGLPGNPVSSLVTFNLVVLPALRRLAGWQVMTLAPQHSVKLLTAGS